MLVFFNQRSLPYLLPLSRRFRLLESHLKIGRLMTSASWNDIVITFDQLLINKGSRVFSTLCHLISFHPISSLTTPRATE